MRVMRLLFAAGLLAVVPRAAMAQRRLGYYAEVGGNGGFASLNLDLRPAARLHLRAGGGLLLWPTVPLTASYVLGHGNSGLEIGGGATVLFFPPEDPDDPFGQRLAELITFGKGVGTVAFASGVLGYRHEGPTGSLFRVTFTPYYGHGHLLAWGGISFGGAF